MQFEFIKSRQNSRIKLLKKLARKKYRYRDGRFLVESLSIINDALKSGHNFRSLYITENFKDRHKEKIDYLKNYSKDAEFFIIDEKVNKYYSELDTPSGITAVYEIKQASIIASKPVVYLNGISDPGNLGAIMRTMLAFNFVNLVVDSKCADIYNAKTVNAARDSIFKLHIEKDKDGAWLKKNKKSLPIYVTSSKNGINLDKIKPAKIYCLVLGSESHGISEKIMIMAKEKIKIEITDKIESLNVASAAAIILHKLQ